MARIIEIDKSTERKVTHRDCGAVIGYFQNEVRHETHYDYGGGSDLYYYIPCPNCGKKVEVKGY